MNQVIGHYRIVKELGRGGMGVVYQAHEESLNRSVAIKVLGEHLSHDQSFVKRFVREAQSAAQLSHPNVIQIYFIGQHEDSHYFVMEFVEGRSVHEILKQEGALEPARAVRMVYQAASGLASAHDVGLVHRDIKPANLLVAKGDLVKIADFGLALMPEDAATRLTATGMLMGTPGYLSPEQCSGEAADARSDIYSLGMTFYEMLAGAMPFKGESPLAVLRQILHEQPAPLTEVNPRVDSAVARIVEKMIAKDPAERYQSCHLLLSDLESLPTSSRVAGAASLLPAAAVAGAASVSPAGAVSGASHFSPTVVVGSPPVSAPSLAAAPPAPALVVPQGSVSVRPRGATAVVVQPEQRLAPIASPTAPRRRLTPILIALVLLVGIAGAAVVGGFFLLEDWLGEQSAGKNSPPTMAISSAASSAASRSTKRSGEAIAGGDALGSPGPAEHAELGSASTGGAPIDAKRSSVGTGLAPAAADTAASSAAAADRSAKGALAGRARDPEGGRLQAAAPAPAPSTHAALEQPSQRAEPRSPAEPRQRTEPEKPRPLLPATPRVAVIAHGEPSLAAAAEEALESQLARHGFELVDEHGLLELRDLGGSSGMSPSSLVPLLAESDVQVLVLLDAEPVSQRELNALGRWDVAVTSRLRVNAFLTANGRSMGRGWNQQAEYTGLNVVRQAEQAIGSLSGDLAEEITQGWAGYRREEGQGP